MRDNATRQKTIPRWPSLTVVINERRPRFVRMVFTRHKSFAFVIIADFLPRIANRRHTYVISVHVQVVQLRVVRVALYHGSVIASSYYYIWFLGPESEVPVWPGASGPQRTVLAIIRSDCRRWVRNAVNKNIEKIHHCENQINNTKRMKNGRKTPRVDRASHTWAGRPRKYSVFAPAAAVVSAALAQRRQPPFYRLGAASRVCLCSVPCSSISDWARFERRENVIRPIARLIRSKLNGLWTRAALNIESRTIIFIYTTDLLLSCAYRALYIYILSTFYTHTHTHTYNNLAIQISKNQTIEWIFL